LYRKRTDLYACNFAYLAWRPSCDTQSIFFEWSFFG
jgi:hypothetical protein